MTDEIKELQETFGDKMKALKRFTYYKAGKNDDLQQEALLATWRKICRFVTRHFVSRSFTR